MQPKSGLNKNLSVISLSIFGIGIIIGAGVYAVLGAAAGIAGNSLWVSFLIAAIVAFFTAFSYCELATLFPSAGAEYIYLRKTHPTSRLPSFLLGFVLILAGAATAATVALGFGGYLSSFIDLPKSLSALILMILATFINCLGIKDSSRTNLIFTIIEIVGLLLVIWFGFTSPPIVQLDLKISAGTLTVSSIIFFVYLGFEDIANLAEETREPEKNIPRAILWSLAITTLLYIAVAFAVTRLAPPEILARSDLPLAEAIKNVAPRWVNVLSAIALFSTANTALITLLAISRMVYGIANEGDLPVLLTRINSRFQTPVLASLLTLLFASAFLMLGELKILASVSSFAALGGFLVVNYTVIALRYLQPDLLRPFKSPINIGRFPLLAGLGFIAIILLCSRYPFEVYLIGIGMLLLGCLSYFLTKRFR